MKSAQTVLISSCFIVAAHLVRICAPNAYFIENMQDFCLLRQRNLGIRRIRFIENKAAVRDGKTVQRKDIPVLFEKTPCLCLFPAPTLPGSSDTVWHQIYGRTS